MCPLIAVIRFHAATIMALAGVVVGFEIYLCLWKTVADTLAPVSNGFDPGHFSGETGGTVEVPDFWLDAWQFVHIVDGL